MAAGLGFKTFTTGEVLTAADTNGYLMQGVLVFATAAARDAAITSPQEGQFAFTKDTNGLWYYDGAAWVASGATGDIEGVTAGTGISGGGTSGTVTVTNSMATAITTNGDTLYGTGSGTFSRLGIGSTGNVLTVAGGIPSWAAPASGGGMTLLSTTTLTGTSVTLTIPSGYIDLVLFIENYYAAATTALLLEINGDTTALNYLSTIVRGTGTTASNGVDNSWTGVEISGSAIANSDNDNVSNVYLPNYLSTIGRKMIISSSGLLNSSSAKSITLGNAMYSGTTGAITSLKIKNSAVSAWTAGTATLYGVK